MSKAVVFVPRDGDSEPERSNIAPASVNFIRESKRFNIQINFPIE